jgi:penicillin-insensitive murein DD-endopeptidase
MRSAVNTRWLSAVALVLALGGTPAYAEGEEPKPNLHAPTPGNVVQPIKPREPEVAAKALFGAIAKPAPLAARAIGSYAKGCLAGGTALPIDGPAWQAMRLSRNRNWGHPKLVALVQTLAQDAKAKDGWSGLLVGDISQPRGGPMLTGHASHQIGLDADIWFTPMPNRTLSAAEREEMSAVSMLAASELEVDPKVFTATHVKVLKRAASYADVERVLVHPAIKRAICMATATDTDRAWLTKVRPIWGHYYHFHIRIGCPAGSTTCAPQAATPGDDGCGKELDDWYKLLTAPPGPPEKPKPALTLEQLPAECRVVLQAGR